MTKNQNFESALFNTADKMNDLTATLAKQMIKEKELDDDIKVQLAKIGFEL